ncbi:MAG: hypothetical protein FJ161_03130 [Gammaproteobacteria bacterium]|nr:hypothetical protein [Gammaproteobacteria bacterium]
MSIALYFQALVLDRRYVSQQYRTTSKKEENNLASIHQVFDPEIQAMRISNEASLENNSTSIVPDTRNIAQKWLETIIIPEADDIDFYSMLSQNVHADFIQGTVLGHPTFKTAEKWCLEHRIRTMIKEDLAIQSANNNTDRVISENTKYLKLLHDHIMPTSPNYNPKDSELRARYMSDIKNYIQQPETTADSNNLFDTAEQVEAINKIRNEIINQMNVRESEIDLNQWEGDRIQLEYKNIRDYLQQQHSDCEQALKKAIYCILSHITLHSDRKKALIKNIIDIIEQQKDSFADDASLAVKNIEDSLYSFIAITLISELSIRSFVTEHTIANAPKILNTAESSKPEHSKRKEAAKKYYNTLSYLTVIIPLLLLINYIARVLPGLTSYTKQPKPNTQQPIRTNTFSYEITDYRIEMLSQAGQQVLNTHRLAYPGSYEQLKQLSSPGSAQVITFNNMKYECYNEIAQPISHDGNITTPQSTLESWDVLQYENPSQVSLVLNNKAGQFQLYATCFEQYTAQYKRNTITKNKNIVEYLLPSNHSDFVQNKAYTQPITEIITWLSSTALVRTLLQYPGSIEELHHLQGAGNFQEIQINGEQFTCAVDGKSKIVENWNVLKSDIGAWNSLLDRTENRPVKLIQFSGNTAYSLSARCTREKPLKMKQSQKPLTQQVKMLSNILHNIEATLSPADIIPATGHILSEPLKPVQVVNYLLDGLYYNTVLYPVYAAINWFVFPVSEIHSIISFIPTQYHVTDWDFYQYAKKNSNHYASAWAQTVLYQKYGQQLKKHSTAVHVMSQHITDRMNIFIDILKLLAYYIVFTVVLSAIRKNKAQLPKDTEQEKNITAEKNQSFEKDTLFTEYVISPVQGFLNHPYEKLIDVSRKEYAPMVFSAAANFSTTNLSTPAIVFTLYSIDTLAQGFKGAPKRAHLSND